MLEQFFGVKETGEMSSISNNSGDLGKFLLNMVLAIDVDLRFIGARPLFFVCFQFHWWWCKGVFGKVECCSRF